MRGLLTAFGKPHSRFGYRFVVVNLRWPVGGNPIVHILSFYSVSIVKVTAYLAGLNCSVNPFRLRLGGI